MDSVATQWIVWQCSGLWGNTVDGGNTVDSGNTVDGGVVNDYKPHHTNVTYKKIIRDICGTNTIDVCVYEQKKQGI